MKEEAAIICGN